MHDEPHDRTSTAQRVAFDPRAMWALARDSVASWIDDFAPSMGAAISYYTVFSIAPLLLIVIAVAGVVLGRDAASGHLHAQLQGMIGHEGAAAIQGMVKSANSPGRGIVASIAGVLALVFGATTAFAELQSALDRIWRSPAAAKPAGAWGLVRSRMLSFGLILTIAFLLLVSLVVSAALSALGAWWAPYFGSWDVLLQAVNVLASFVIVTVLFAAIYKWLPRSRIDWHDVWIGAIVTSLLFTLGKFAIGLYIGRSGVVSGFGAAGSVVVLLVWVYYSAQIFLLGAEFTWVYAYRYGSRAGGAPAAPIVVATPPGHAVAIGRPSGPPAAPAEEQAAARVASVRATAGGGPSVDPHSSAMAALRRHWVALVAAAGLVGLALGRTQRRDGS